jgi:hypothetical protein
MFPQSGEIMDQSLRVADRSLYEAKHRGRNQTVFADPLGNSTSACAVKCAGSQRVHNSRPGTVLLHPEAIGALLEETKLLKPPM